MSIILFGFVFVIIAGAITAFIKHSREKKSAALLSKMRLIETLGESKDELSRTKEKLGYLMSKLFISNYEKERLDKEFPDPEKRKLEAAKLLKIKRKRFERRAGNLAVLLVERDAYGHYQKLEKLAAIKLKEAQKEMLSPEEIAFLGQHESIIKNAKDFLGQIENKIEAQKTEYRSDKHMSFAWMGVNSMWLLLNIAIVLAAFAAFPPILIAIVGSIAAICSLTVVSINLARFLKNRVKSERLLVEFAVEHRTRKYWTAFVEILLLCAIGTLMAASIAASVLCIGLAWWFWLGIALFFSAGLFGIYRSASSSYLICVSSDSKVKEMQKLFPNLVREIVLADDTKLPRIFNGLSDEDISSLEWICNNEETDKSQVEKNYHKLLEEEAALAQAHPVLCEIALGPNQERLKSFLKKVKAAKQKPPKLERMFTTPDKCGTHKAHMASRGYFAHKTNQKEGDEMILLAEDNSE